MRDLLTEFRKFVMKGNLVEIAVAFILALYFKDVVDTFTNGIVLAFVAAVFGEPNFASITIGLGDAEILIGAFLNAIINFLLVAAVLFFIVKVYTAMKDRLMRSGEETEALTREGELLTEIRDLLAARQ
ncbi:MAG TPA: large conductance mechanosensitive channel protein MscL [Acidimicrobiia bacterium]|nr:large conductance mechanosensitive channel protein MscL [Acidimicrobiia bacterium]